MSDDEYMTRVAVHGSVPEDVPGDIEVTNEERDAIVEILFVRSDDEYRVMSRHHQTLFLDHGGGPFDEFGDALESAIETARDEGLPLLRRIYSWVPVSEADELGVDRIPIPWEDDE
ncbi:hypothetical protein [Haloarcula amylolytica]|uniref:Uncharacterized protein n=1 Tax=Haloarcula amylolytica JCM 13557 TaxID=1227452 RepID=M0K6P4_9EURY|nr:hypothetical protein [Haloarcula amylolytica]EMA17037.1 hypothetical protein C442_17245 [Haloarcula amylolytica JCM 13557]